MKFVAIVVATLTIGGVTATTANAHALPLKRKWSALSLHQKEHYVTRNIAHAKGALAVLKKYRWSSLRPLYLKHKRLLRKATANLKVIEAKLHPPFQYPWWWVPLGICETGSNPPDPAFVGGGYEGWINFLNSTWLTYGGGQFAAHAYDATEYEQYIVTMRMHADVPWSQSNPACSAMIGM